MAQHQRELTLQTPGNPNEMKALISPPMAPRTVIHSALGMQCKIQSCHSTAIIGDFSKNIIQALESFKSTQRTSLNSTAQAAGEAPGDGIPAPRAVGSTVGALNLPCAWRVGGKQPCFTPQRLFLEATLLLALQLLNLHLIYSCNSCIPYVAINI